MRFSIARIVIAVIFFVSGFIAALVAVFNLDVTKELLPSLATLFAAFSGAWFAYLLQAKDRDEYQKKKTIASANRVLFSLFQRANALTLIQIDFIDPQRNNPGKHIAMRPILNTDNDVIDFDIGNLDFLLGTKYEQIVFDLYIEDRRYESAVQLIEHRSKLHYEEVQPRLEKAGIKNNLEYEKKDFEVALGDLLYSQLKSSTDDMVYHVDRTASSLVDVKNKLLVALKEMFPNEKFTNFKVTEEKI